MRASKSDTASIYSGVSHPSDHKINNYAMYVYLARLLSPPRKETPSILNGRLNWWTRYSPSATFAPGSHPQSHPINRSCCHHQCSGWGGWRGGMRSSQGALQSADSQSIEYVDMLVTLHYCDYRCRCGSWAVAELMNQEGWEGGTSRNIAGLGPHLSLTGGD